MTHFYDLNFIGYELKEAMTKKKVTIILKIKEDNSSKLENLPHLKRLKCRIRQRKESSSEFVCRIVYASVLFNFNNSTFDLTKAKRKTILNRLIIKLLNENYGNKSIYSFENNKSIIMDQYIGYDFNTLLDIRIIDHSKILMYIYIDRFPGFESSNFDYFELLVSEDIKLIFFVN